MSDHDALLAAILADRDDDTARLVYADWYEENDQPERAEFIRVQVELAQMVDEQIAVKAIDDSPILRDLEKATFKRKPISDEFWDSIWRCRALRRRERELLERHRGWHEWAGVLLEVVPLGAVYYDHLTYTRGFVSSLTCSWDAWRTHADAIVRSQPIERVKLTTRPESWPPDPDYPIAQWLKLTWPRIEFELPPPPVTVQVGMNMTNSDRPRIFLDGVEIVTQPVLGNPEQEFFVGLAESPPATDAP